MVKCLAWDFGSRKIIVNCIAPGGFKTDMYAEAAAKNLPDGDRMTLEEIDAKISQWSPMGRPGFPDDIAGIVALLSSPEARWITGQTVHASCGAYMTQLMVPCSLCNLSCLHTLNSIRVAQLIS
ncbi:hypothetical protein POJ06DRAFT_255644 [Lipomyces tetrasporus]|uniref:Uncharacterized protein n=1 Tax=Lipomyces tetrasporus TaxID=54092 RepID=A0AAD7VSK2_9ASCO|nr:uncharacterized protein POJ06DRAFT_255644 [Lipomyces tetrasporus]KAJ8100181.1 hypothetical protein POJ06DRAFT_255644 [Lipomyces tetrasporus]